jgi:C4-dicarboxylate-specific signal transduction histidine kinase
MDRRRKEILLVDGCESDASLYSRILEQRWPAVRLTWVRTLRIALERLTTRSPDAVLLDLELPDSSGLQTMTRVHELTSSVPVVVLTEISDESLGFQAVQMGAQDYLSKITLTGDVLERCLRYAMERMRMVSSIRRRDAELAHLSRLITLGEMASGLAHELKQPLTTIKNYAEASIFRLATVEEGATQRVIENLAAMSRQASHASDIVCHMKSFVEKSVPKAEAASLDKMICDCLSLVDHEVRREGVDVVLQLDPRLPPVWVDRTQIKQVVLNLIRNSIEAVAASGAECREIKLRTFVRGEEEGVLVVSDTGPGLHPDAKGRIFEPFYSTKKGGMGMGLAICTSIVEAHGGKIEATLKPSGGAEFCVALPLALCGSRSDANTATATMHRTMRSDSAAVDADAITESV